MKKGLKPAAVLPSEPSVLPGKQRDQAPERGEAAYGRTLVIFAGIVAAAFLLRAWRLGYQSFWQDEGFSAALSSGSFGYILRQSFTVEPNPPFYFLLLRAWRMAAGSSEYAIRFLSLLPSVLAVAALFVIGKRVRGRRLALVAAALAACSPFLVWLAQEARMYSWELLWLSLGAYFLLRGLQRDTRLWWLLFTAANVLAVYTHLYAVFVVLAEGLYLLAVRRWRPAIFSTGLAVLLFLPWFISVTAYSGDTSTWRGFIGVMDMLRVLLLNFASQAHLPGRLDDWYSWLLGLAVLAGLITLLRRRTRARSGWLLLLWLLFPIAAVYALSFKEPLFSPRYFIVVVPAFLLLAAGALTALPAPAALAGLALFSGMSVWAVVRGNTVPSYAKEDYRLAGNYVGARTDSGDVILLVANYIYYPFQYYFHGQGQLLPLNVTPDGDVDPLLAPLASRYDHIWLVEAHDVFVDPSNHVGQWLRSRYTVADEKYITGIHFIEFDPHSTLSSLPASAVSRDVRWSGGPELAGYELRPGNPFGVRLFWKANGALPENDHISLKLWKSGGKLGGQQDGEPLNAGLQFSRFPYGGFVRDDHYIDAPPGVYDLRMSVYLHDDLPIEGQQERQLDLGTATVPSRFESR